MSIIKPDLRFFQVNRKIIEFEVRPGRTVTFISEVDLTAIEHVRAQGNRSTYTAFVAKAVALALKEFPYANQRITRRIWRPFARPRLQQFDHIDIAVAAERNIPGAEGVAFVDIVRDADLKSLQQIGTQLRALANADPDNNPQWRQFSSVAERLPVWLSCLLVRLPYFNPYFWDRFRGAATLISSPSKYGVDTVVATWSWPVGISYGLVKQRPVVRDGLVAACPTFNLILNFDRRIMAGAQAGRFFNRIVEHLENADTRLTACTASDQEETPLVAQSIAQASGDQRSQATQVL